MSEMIYHATRKLEPPIRERALKSWWNLRGREEAILREGYNRLASKLADYVRDYYENMGEEPPNFPDDRLAMLVGNTSDSWSSNQIKAETLLGIEDLRDFREDPRYKSLVRREKAFNRVIRNGFVYFGRFDFAKGFVDGPGTNYILEVDSSGLDVKKHLHAGSLVWWEVPLSPSRLKAIYTNAPRETRSFLKKQGFKGTKVFEEKFRTEMDFRMF